MCGITGILDISGKSQVSEKLLTSMNKVMVHRGPDGGSVWISDDKRVGFAHRRLSIIDLSKSATQPMSNQDKSVWLTFNGEIYNHDPLRELLVKQGYKFKTDHSDTEVLVHGYSSWGIEGLIERLEGDFAFAIWDNVKKKLFVVRDRIGVKPVYFSYQKDCFLFGSEIKAILQHPSVERDVDATAMYHYLSFLTTPAPMTMFKGIYKLPAGHYMEISFDGTTKTHRYWDAVPGQGIPVDEVKGLSEAAREDFYVTGIKDRLVSAVEKRMMSDVPFGVFLSGGVDSSTNVALMNRYTDKPLETFTVGFKDHTHLNELQYADIIAKKFSTNHHEILIDENDMIGYLSSLVHSQDEPIADWVCIPLYFISKLAHDNGVTVVQVGEGADEQFCGYASYMAYLELYKKYFSPFQKYMPSIAQKCIASLAKSVAKMKPGAEIYADIIDRAARKREHFWSGATVFWDIMKDQLVNKTGIPRSYIPEQLKDSDIFPENYLDLDTFNIVSSFLDNFDEKHPGQDVLTRMIYCEFKLRLPELLLMRVDKITMSESLEARVPFLDHKLVEFSMDIPMEYKVKGREPKYLLKKAVEDWIPHELIYRKKMGFGAPMSEWLRGDFGKTVEGSILSSSLLRRGYFDNEYIATLLKDHRTGRRDNSLYIWTLFNLTAWYDYWIEGIIIGQEAA